MTGCSLRLAPVIIDIGEIRFSKTRSQQSINFKTNLSLYKTRHIANFSTLIYVQLETDICYF